MESKIKFKAMWEGQEIDVAVSCYFTNKNDKYTIAGSVQKLDGSSPKIIYLWDCTPIEGYDRITRKRFQLPMLKIENKAIFGTAKTNTMPFVLKMLDLYKIERGKAKPTYPAEMRVPVGFEPVSDDTLFVGNCR